LASRLEANGVIVENIRPVATSLEDVFIARLSETAG
jgi:hypothetical protein